MHTNRRWLTNYHGQHHVKMLHKNFTDIIRFQPAVQNAIQKVPPLFWLDRTVGNAAVILGFNDRNKLKEC